MEHFFICSASDFLFCFFASVFSLDDADSELGVSVIVVFFKPEVIVITVGSSLQLSVSFGSFHANFGDFLLDTLSVRFLNSFFFSSNLARVPNFD